MVWSVWGGLVEDAAGPGLDERVAEHRVCVAQRQLFAAHEPSLGELRLRVVVAYIGLLPKPPVPFPETQVGAWRSERADLAALERPVDDSETSVSRFLEKGSLA